VAVAAAAAMAASPLESGGLGACLAVSSAALLSSLSGRNPLPAAPQVTPESQKIATGLAEAYEILRGRKLRTAAVYPGWTGWPTDPAAPGAQQHDQSD